MSGQLDGGRRRPRRGRGLILLAVLVIGVVAVLRLEPGTIARLVHPLRLGQVPLPGLGEQDERLRPLVRVPKSARGKSYVFMKTKPDGTPVTFSPCRTWEVVVNPAGGPAGGYDAVVAAVRTVRQATGLNLRVTGTTSERVSFERDAYQPDRYGDHWAPILIGWRPGRGGEHAGEGGPVTATSLGGDAHYVSGVVAIAKDGHFNDDPVALRAILLHELGHVVGLAHVDQPDEIMYPLQDDQREYGSGDLAGLAALGRGECAAGV